MEDEPLVSDEVALTFYLPETDFSGLDIDFALTAIRPLLSARSPYSAAPPDLGIVCAYQILRRLWQRYCEAVQEPTWLERYPPVDQFWSAPHADHHPA